MPKVLKTGIFRAAKGEGGRPTHFVQVLESPELEERVQRDWEDGDEDVDGRARVLDAVVTQQRAQQRLPPIICGFT